MRVESIVDQEPSVLIVDDDAAIRELLDEFLADHGYRSVPAADGAEAIAQLNTTLPRPSIMLLDLLMPEVNGYEVLDYLKSHGMEDLPVLIFSAQRPANDLLAALDAERRDFIAKPFDLEELHIRLQRLLQRAVPADQKHAQDLRVYTLGALRVFRGDELLFDEGWRNKSAKTIFKRLFTGKGQRYPKDVLVEQLWPEADPEVGANRLRVAVHELRKVLGDRGRGEGAQSHIGQQEGSYFFDVSVSYWSDVEAFDAHVQAGHAAASRGHGEEALDAYARAETLYAGDYLRDDPFFEWSVATRERLRETHLAMLADAARIYAELGKPDEAATFCRNILRSEPWREEVYRSLMRYLVDAGRPLEAIRAYDECRRSLQAELDAGPSPETTKLRDQITEAMRSRSA